jgi:hypothetical protein
MNFIHAGETMKVCTSWLDLNDLTTVDLVKIEENMKLISAGTVAYSKLQNYK